MAASAVLAVKPGALYADVADVAVGVLLRGISGRTLVAAGAVLVQAKHVSIAQVAPPVEGLSTTFRCVIMVVKKGKVNLGAV